MPPMELNEWLKHAPTPRDLMPPLQWHVFLSYRSVNRTWVLNLYDILTTLNFKVFMDQYQLLGGDELMTRLASGLKGSQAGILIWSKDAANSAWVSKEYQRLQKRAIEDPNFRFVPIKLDDTPLPEFADTAIFQDFSSYPDGPNGGELMRLLHGIAGQPMEDQTIKFANRQDEAARNAMIEINAALKIGDPESIVQMADQDTLPWRTLPVLGCKAADNLIKMGKYDEALTILRKLEERFPKAIRTRQLHALALARLGAGSDELNTQKDNLLKAQRILSVLYENGQRDPETLGILGRTWMDRYELSKDDADLEQSRDCYAEAFEKATDDYYTGINAAAKSVLLATQEDLDKAAGYAKRTQGIVGVDPCPGDYWKTATVAELFLIQKDYTKAGAMYAAAIRIEPKSTGSHETTKRQAERLLDKLDATQSERQTTLAAFKKRQ